MRYDHWLDCHSNGPVSSVAVGGRKWEYTNAPRRGGKCCMPRCKEEALARIRRVKEKANVTYFTERLLCLTHMRQLQVEQGHRRP